MANPLNPQPNILANAANGVPPALPTSNLNNPTPTLVSKNAGGISPAAPPVKAPTPVKVPAPAAPATDQWVQTPGGKPVLLSSTPYKTLQEASDKAELLPVAAPITPPAGGEVKPPEVVPPPTEQKPEEKAAGEVKTSNLDLINNLVKQGAYDAQSIVDSINSNGGNTTLAEVNNTLASDPLTNNLYQNNGIMNNLDTSYKDHMKALSDIASGNFTLSAGEQALVDQVTNTYNDLRAEQLKANANYEGSVQLGNIRSGQQEFMNQIASGSYKAAVDQGIAKIKSLDAEALSKVQELQQAFEDNRTKDANTAYDSLTKLLDEKKSNLDSMYTKINDAYKDARDYNNKVSQQNIDNARNATNDASNLLNNQMEMLSKTVEGGKVNIPGVGEVTVNGVANGKPETVTVGNKLYLWDASSNSFKDTGIAADQMTPDKIVDALKTIDPQAAKDYMVSKGLISSEVAGGGATGGVSIPTGTLAATNNNPGNLRFAGQAGATQGEGGFAKFDTPEAGYAALKSQIDLDKSRGLTCSAFITKYAPPSENDTSTYINQMCNALGVNPTDKLDSLSTDDVAKFIAQKESGTTVNATVFTSAMGTTGKTKIDTSTPGYSSTPLDSAGGLTQSAIDQAALNFAITGQMPSIGLGSTGAAGNKRTAIQNRAAELDAGGNIALNKGILASDTTALKQQTQYLATLQRSVVNADLGFNQILSTFKDKNINKSDKPISNIISNATKYQLGNGDVSALRSALAELSNEYTLVFSRGGQASDIVRKQAQDIIDGNLSLNNLQKVNDELQALGSVNIKGSKDQVDYWKKDINGIIPGAADILTGNSTAGQKENIGGSDIKSQVKSAGLDYDKMIADGYTDEQITQALNSK